MRAVVICALGLVACAPAATSDAKVSTPPQQSASVALPTPPVTPASSATSAPTQSYEEPDRALLELALGGVITSAWRTSVTVVAVESRQGHFAWNGSAFAATTLPRDATVIEPSDAPRMIFGDLEPESTSNEPVKIWASADGATRFVLFRHSFPAAHTALVPHTNAMWMSERAVNVVDLWAASPGSFRRVFGLLSGLATLAEPNVIVDLPVEMEGVELRVGAAMTTCTADRRFAGDSARIALDRSMATRICAGRGRYKWDGKAFTLVK